ncbi:pyridoxamine 5'-phosphate oxidase family protein [Photobacterium sp. OFAV2-7]|uniref:pyridoxamine 5'-phosphate oxidase family protein n=1 Tax=Photobacterium sp. OFAV2-7 TaxID=2917748 RepID=UPI001EF5D421|nr:pyridoxamine 5'-phosphate oxidase family protein [Photobacterium sp. OFAV2-7]MCG7587067.1 pyridoxamine 5'-phosphate oxidase family protein [Photobacterium sp. OFAV2-7]
MLSNTARTTIKKGAHKSNFNVNELYKIIDESLLAHVAIIDSGMPVVIPMLAWRVDDRVYIHGARNSRLLRNLKQGQQTCMTFTLFDGWVLARSAMHHSAHYRSAVVFGQFEVVENNREKDRLLNLFIEQIAPGRTKHIRLGNEKELTATELLSISLDEASVKIGNNGVNDDRADLDIPVWAGVLPYRTVVGPLQDTPDLADGIAQPDYAAAYGSRWVDNDQENL